MMTPEKVGLTDMGLWIIHRYDIIKKNLIGFCQQVIESSIRHD